MAYVRPMQRHGAKTKSRKIKRRPEWDDTVQDLSVHKASEDEIRRRIMSHQSKNMDLVRADKFKQNIRRGKAHKSPKNGAKARKALLKEILYDNSQLHDVLAKSDKAMAVVKDLFGDDPFKFRGVPHVTTAPRAPKYGVDLDSSLPDGSKMEQMSKLDALSESLMDDTALNDLEQSDSDDEASSDEEGVNYKTQIDMERFQRLLDLADSERGGVAVERALDHAARRLLKAKQDADTSLREKDGDLDESIQDLLPETTAINDTGKINKHRSRIADMEEEDRKSALDMQDFTKVLDGLQSTISDYERQTGRQPSANRLTNNTYSGFTMSLVDAITRLTGYLKESELKFRAESTIREQLQQDNSQLRSLIDALTSDIIVTQEDHASLKADYSRYKRDTSIQLAQIKDALTVRGIVIPRHVQEQNPHNNIGLVNSHQSLYENAVQQMNRLAPNSVSQLVPTQSIPQQRLITDTVPQNQYHRGDSNQVSPRDIPPASAIQIQQRDTRSVEIPNQYPQQRPLEISNGYPQQFPLPERLQGQTTKSQEFQNQPIRGQQFQNQQIRAPQNQNQNALNSEQQRVYLPQYAPSTDNESLSSQPIDSASQRSTISEVSKVSQEVPTRDTSNRPQDFRLQQPWTPHVRGETDSATWQRIASKGIKLKPPIEQQQQPQNQGDVNDEEVMGISTVSSSLQQQIAELNKQHEQAQTKLHSLLQQKKQFEEIQAKGLTETKRAAVVSPPISPISVVSEDGAPQMQAPVPVRATTNRSAREIYVSLPRMDQAASPGN